MRKLISLQRNRHALRQPRRTVSESAKDAILQLGAGTDAMQSPDSKVYGTSVSKFQAVVRRQSSPLPFPQACSTPAAATNEQC